MVDSYDHLTGTLEDVSNHTTYEHGVEALKQYMSEERHMGARENSEVRKDQGIEAINISKAVPRRKE